MFDISPTDEKITDNIKKRSNCLATHPLPLPGGEFMHRDGQIPLLGGARGNTVELSSEADLSELTPPAPSLAKRGGDLSRFIIPPLFAREGAGG